MINKYTLSRFQNVNYVKNNLEDLIENNLVLSRYGENDPDREKAYQESKRVFQETDRNHRRAGFQI